LSLFIIIGHSAILDPIVRAGAGLACFFWFCGGTVSHCLVHVGAEEIAPFGANVLLSLTVRAGLRSGAGFRCGVLIVFGFGSGIDVAAFRAAGVCAPVVSLVHVAVSGRQVLRPPGEHPPCPHFSPHSGPVRYRPPLF